MKIKPGDIVWIRGIAGRECASWQEVFVNNDRHCLYIENMKDVRKGRAPQKKCQYCDGPVCPIHDRRRASKTAGRGRR